MAGALCWRSNPEEPFLDRRLFLASLALLPAASAFALEATNCPSSPCPPASIRTPCPAVWFGSGPSAIEIFDYNCPYCRKAFHSLDVMVAKKSCASG